MSDIFLTVEDALYMLEDTPAKDNAEIVWLPPEDESQDFTDEEEDDDNLAEVQYLTELAGNVEIFSEKEIERIEAEKVKNFQPKIEWSDTYEFEEIGFGDKLPKLYEKHPNLCHMSPYQLFSLFFGEEVYSLIITESEKYAKQKSHESFHLAKHELDIFLAIILASGYYSYPFEHEYWLDNPFFKIKLFENTITYSRFQEIKRFFHLADNNNLQPNNKLAKVQPYLDLMQINFMRFGVFSKCLSLDEQSIPHCGYFKTLFVERMRPQINMKVWVLASAEGYPFSFQVYTGKHDSIEGVPFGERVVKDLIAVIENNKQHVLYIANFFPFSSTSLCRDLKSKELRCTSAVRQHKTEDCPLTPLSEMKKKERGSFETFGDGEVIVCQWRNSQSVCVVSNHERPEPASLVKYRVSRRKQYADVIEPFMIQKHNEFKIGVNLLNQYLDKYRPTIRNKKWWWCLFSHFLNMAVVAAWRIHKNVGGSFSHLDFRQKVVSSLYKKAMKKYRGRTGESPRRSSLGLDSEPAPKQIRC